MNTESTREHCMSLRHVTENVQWGADLLFKIGGKMFAVMSLEPSRVVLSFKATPDKFFELQEVEGIVPAPYMARNQWLALERWDVLRDDDLRDLLNTSYELVFAKLPRKTQQALMGGTAIPARITKPVAKPKKPKKKSATKERTDTSARKPTISKKLTKKRAKKTPKKRAPR
jgi:predicted DNA-binding protein (MmcQ/YjbR family)